MSSTYPVKPTRFSISKPCLAYLVIYCAVLIQSQLSLQMISSPSESYEIEDGSVYKIQDLEYSLEKAMQNITQLQANLSFMIMHNHKLTEEHELEKRRQTDKVKQLENKLHKQEQEITKLQHKNHDYYEILEETKMALEENEVEVRTKDDEVRRAEKVIYELKGTINELEEELMNSKYCDVSLQSQYNHQQIHDKLQKLQNQNESNKYENDRLNKKLEKELGKNRKMEKQMGEFKTWMSRLAKVGKVVEGCEQVIMDEIESKVNLANGF